MVDASALRQYAQGLKRTMDVGGDFSGDKVSQRKSGTPHGKNNARPRMYKGAGSKRAGGKGSGTQTLADAENTTKDASPMALIPMIVTSDNSAAPRTFCKRNAEFAVMDDLECDKKTPAKSAAKIEDADTAASNDDSKRPKLTHDESSASDLIELLEYLPDAPHEDMKTENDSSEYYDDASDSDDEWSKLIKSQLKDELADSV